MRIFIALTVFIVLAVSTSSTFGATPPVQRETPFKNSYIFAPKDGKIRAGVFMLHGSAGGSVVNMWVQAMYLVSHGYSVMTYCWFDCRRDLLFEPAEPQIEIELKNTVQALAWFREYDLLRGKKVAVFGISRGAEQALILGSLEDRLGVKIDAIAVHAPSDVVVAGFNNNWKDKRCWICQGGKACEEKPENWNPSCGDINAGHEDPFKIPAWLWEGKPLETGNRIEIEKFSGPIFITAGEDDSVWESDRTRRIEKTLRDAGKSPEVHIFPNEGHAFSNGSEQRRKEMVAAFLKRVLR